ncbi:MAG: epoxyqueuosine reductase QueH [Hydrogenothermaceae bacterium]|nr:epoxyqueuosine reductase QueH [Hydrogenothermaceae bacterium]
MGKILVHICCGVDSVYALRVIKDQMPDKELVGYFYDPNIHPQQEYELRWIETKRVCDSLGIECIKGEYELDIWLQRVKGYESEPERGERCSICHDLRLEKSAQLAKELGANYLTTVLMMSPKKEFEVLKSIGERVANKYGLEFLTFDFRKKCGVEKMNLLSRQFQLYHQNYCGCVYGLFSQRMEVKFYPELTSFSKGRLAGSREELLFIKQIRLFAENLGIECFEKQFSFIKWSLTSSILKIDGKEIFHKVLPYSVSVKGVLRDRVEKFVETPEKKIYRLHKSNLEIWKINKIDDFLYDEMRFNTDPVFLVEEDINLGAKIEIQLKSDFDPSGKSQNLVIGNLKALEMEVFYSDTDYYGAGGYELQDITSFLYKNQTAIRKSKLCVVIFGAHFCGKIGERIFHQSLSNTEILSM